jgi:HEAT repeat protein
MTDEIFDAPAVRSGLDSDDPDAQIQAVRAIRRFLEGRRGLVLDAVLESNFMPRLVELIHSRVRDVAYESLWSLSILTSGPSAAVWAVIHEQGVPALTNVLTTHADLELRAQAAACLGGIGAESTITRDMVYRHAWDSLLAALEPPTNSRLTRYASFGVRVLCSGRPRPPTRSMVNCVPVLVRLLDHPDSEAQGQACLGLAEMEESGAIDAFIALGAVPRLVELLSHPLAPQHGGALRALGQMSSGTEKQTDALLAAKPLPKVIPFLESAEPDFQRDAIWLISNLAAGTPSQLQALFDVGFLPRIVALLSSEHVELRRGAAWTMENAATSESSEHVRLLAESDCIAPLCAALGSADGPTALAALGALEGFLKLGPDDEHRRILERMNAAGVSEAIEKAQMHPSIKVYEKAKDLLSRYWETLPE